MALIRKPVSETIGPLALCDTCGSPFRPMPKAPFAGSCAMCSRAHARRRRPSAYDRGPKGRKRSNPLLKFVGRLYKD